MAGLDEVKDGFLEGLRERLREPFFFAFTLALLSCNWKAFYVLVRPPEKASPAEVYALFDDAWDPVGFVPPFVIALVISVVYPFASVASAAFRKGVSELRANVLQWMELRTRRMTVATLREHGEYKKVVAEKSAYESYLLKTWLRMNPRAASRNLISIYTCPDPAELPCFMLVTGRDHNVVHEVSKLPSGGDEGRLAFVFEEFQGDRVVGAVDDGMVFWPEKYQSTSVLVLDSNTRKTIPLPEKDKRSEYVIGVVRLGKDQRHLGRVVTGDELKKLTGDPAPTPSFPPARVDEPLS